MSIKDRSSHPEKTPSDALTLLYFPAGCHPSLRSSLIRVSFHLVWSLESGAEHQISFVWYNIPSKVMSVPSRSLLQQLWSRVWVILSAALQVVWGDKMLLGAITGPLMFGSFCCSAVGSHLMPFFNCSGNVCGKSSDQTDVCMRRSALNLQDKWNTYMLLKYNMWGVSLLEIK